MILITCYDVEFRFTTKIICN